MSQYINTYFSDLIFTSVENSGEYTIYAAHINTQLAGDKLRYVLAVVPTHMAIKNKCKLNELQWINIQTRSLPQGKYKLAAQRWKSPDNSVPHISLSIVSRNDKSSKYYFNPESSQCPSFPFEILLLHDPKKNTIYQYPNNINFIWAIDQFQTILTPLQQMITIEKEENLELL